MQSEAETQQIQGRKAKRQEIGKSKGKLSHLSYQSSRQEGARRQKRCGKEKMGEVEGRKDMKGEKRK